VMLNDTANDQAFCNLAEFFDQGDECDVFHNIPS